MNSHRKLLEDIVQAATIVSSKEFTWLGVRQSPWRESDRRAIDPKTAYAHLHALLQRCLYTNCFCQGRVAAAREALHDRLPRADPVFLSRLVNAVGTQHYVAGGWIVGGMNPRAVVLRRNGLTIHVPRDSSALRSEAVEPGMHVGVALATVNEFTSPGFLTVLGERELREADVLRVYLNVSPDGAVVLLQDLPSRLNHAGLPFRLKVLNHPSRFERCDSAVLYLRRQEYPCLTRIAAPKLAEMSSRYFRCETPAFTKHIAYGMSVAEQPSGAGSFGMHRCGIVARALIESFKADEVRPDARVDRVVRLLERSGVDLDAPFLSAGHEDAYETWSQASVPQIRKRARVGFDSVDEDRRSQSERCLEAARKIGDCLIADALWCGSACNWLDEALSRTEGEASVHAALGPDLYGGTSGIALFFGDLFSATGEERFRRHALGALDHAFQARNRIVSKQRTGFYAGLFGVAYSLALLASRLGSEVLAEKAQTVTEEALDAIEVEGEYDLVNGLAGALLGSCLVGHYSSNRHLFARARSIGDVIVAKAKRDGRGWSWSSQLLPSSSNLLGQSHGASGVAYALLLLSHVTGERQFQSAAFRAFDYEDSWLTGPDDNWPDLRVRVGASSQDVDLHQSMTAWCHGAPGIGLARLAAVLLTGEKRWLASVDRAMLITRRRAETLMNLVGEDLSLCHGLCGLGDIMQLGNQALEDSPEEEESRIVDAALKYGDGTFSSWPCGAGCGEVKGILLGTSGIGHFFLRQHDHRIPSILHPIMGMLE